MTWLLESSSKSAKNSTFSLMRLHWSQGTPRSILRSWGWSCGWLFRDHQPQGQSWGPEVDPAVDCLEITNPKVNPEVLRSILRLIYTINNIVFIDIFQFFLNNWGDHTSIYRRSGLRETLNYPSLWRTMRKRVEPEVNPEVISDWLGQSWGQSWG